MSGDFQFQDEWQLQDFGPSKLEPIFIDWRRYIMDATGLPLRLLYGNTPNDIRAFNKARYTLYPPRPGQDSAMEIGLEI